MKTIPGRENRLARQLATLGLPPLRADDGSVELSIQGPRAKVRRVIEKYPSDRIPRVGDLISLAIGEGEQLDFFAVVEVRHLLAPRARETIRAVLLLVKKPPSPFY